MKAKLVREKLVTLLETPENDVKYQAFIDEYIGLLDQVKINADTANIAIEAITIDHGVNFLDAFANLDKKQVLNAWKATRDCASFKNNKDYNALKLMGAFTTSALEGEANTASILGNILTAVVNLTKLPKQGEVQPEVCDIIREYILEVIPKDSKLPEWKNVKMTTENALEFCTVMEKILESSSVKDAVSKIPAAFSIKKWISMGKQYAEEERILKEREKNKPIKRSKELLALSEHFKMLEDELDKSVHKEIKLTIQRNFLQEELAKSEALGREREKTIKTLQDEIEELKSKVTLANQEVDKRKKLNDAQVKYREDSQASLLQDIASALKPEYEDYAETKDVLMNNMLGEIYREKIKQIFKILDQKGIKVEK